MTEEIIIENAFHLCQRLEQENKKLKKQIESQKGLITVGGKQQYEMTMAYDRCKSALEEIREMVLYCKDEYNCDRCKYHDDCLIDDDKFPDLSKALVNKINEVLNG